MKQKNQSPELAQIKSLLGTEKLIIGKERTIKLLKTGEVQTVFVSSNCPDGLRDDLTRYAKLGEAQVLQLEKTNTELGTICRKPFAVSVLSVLKD